MWKINSANPRFTEKDEQIYHEEAVPFIWLRGKTFLGSPGGGHYEIVEDNATELGLDTDVDWELIDDFSYGSIPNAKYVGRIWPDGDVIAWNLPDVPENIAAEIRQEAGIPKHATVIWKDGQRYILDPTKKTAQVPADYTEDDPLDIDETLQLVDDLATQWWMEDHATQRQAIANAFRAALTSPRQNLKWNSIVYQDLMHLAPELDDPEEFERTIRERKEKWDRFGQQTIDLLNEKADDPEWIDYGPQVIEKYMPGIWRNIRNAAVIGPYIEDLRQAAIYDISQGGDGRKFREALMQMDIPGIGPKIAAFVWLLLAPKTSRLATIDVHMMRVLGQRAESPKDYRAYLELEAKLDAMRKEMGYEDVPLGAFQWALWDQQRTPGYHQDHTPLRPLNPVDWRNVDWVPQERAKTTAPPAEIPGQMTLEPEMPVVEPPTQNNPEPPLLEEDFITPPGQVGDPWQPQAGWVDAEWNLTKL